MIVQHFLRWVETAPVKERAAAANALARAYVLSELPFEERCAAEAALTLLLDDPSAKVRQAIAEPLSMAAQAPRQIVEALASDQPEVAATILVRSPLLGDPDLVERIATGDGHAQVLIATRPLLSSAVSAAIAEVGSEKACLALLENSGATIASLSFRRIGERFGDVARIRQALFADPRLPPDTRHMLLVKVGEALSHSPLVASLIGRGRAEKVAREACIKACMSMIDGTSPEEMPALIEHLRLRGDLTSSFIIRAVAHGKIDFFGAVLVALTGREVARVRALLAGGRDIALAALFRAAGLAEPTHAVILTALKIWREVASGRRMAGAQEVSWLMLKAINAAPGQSGPAPEHADLAALLKAVHLDLLRANARGHALAIAAA